MTRITIIRVKYAEKSNDVENGDDGNEKEVIVNIDCPIGLILDYVRESASLGEINEIDLCDEGTNRMKNLADFPSWTRGTDLFEPGSVYFIVKVDRDSDGRISGISPVLNGNNSETVAADVMSKILQPAGPRNRAGSNTGGKSVSHDKVLPGRNARKERRSKIGKPASRDP